MKFANLILTPLLVLTLSCHNSQTSGTATFTEAGVTLVSTAKDIVKTINEGAAQGASLRGDMKISDYYGHLIAQAATTRKLTINNIEFQNLRDFFIKNKTLIATLDKQYKNISAYRQATAGTGTRPLTASEVLSALKMLNSIMNQPDGSRSLALNQAFSSNRSIESIASLALADGDKKDMNGGCTEQEAVDYREKIATPLCRSSKKGREYLDKASKIVGYVSTASTFTGAAAEAFAAGSTATAAGAGAAAGAAEGGAGAAATAAGAGAAAGAAEGGAGAAAVGAAAGSVGIAAGLLGGAIGLVLARASMDAKYYCPQVVGAKPLQYCECSSDSSCHSDVSGS